MSAINNLSYLACMKTPGDTRRAKPSGAPAAASGYKEGRLCLVAIDATVGVRGTQSEPMTCAQRGSTLRTMTHQWRVGLAATGGRIFFDTPTSFCSAEAAARNTSEFT